MWIGKAITSDKWASIFDGFYGVMTFQDCNECRSSVGGEGEFICIPDP